MNKKMLFGFVALVALSSASFASALDLNNVKSTNGGLVLNTTATKNLKIKGVQTASLSDQSIGAAVDLEFEAPSYTPKLSGVDIDASAKNTGPVVNLSATKNVNVSDVQTFEKTSAAVGANVTVKTIIK